MSEAIVIIRPSFKKFCGQDACRASLFNQLLFWIAGKAKGQPEDKILSGEVYWYGSAEDIYKGIDESWSTWKIRKEVDVLVESFIGRRHNQKKKWDREYQYFIGPDQGKAIREACEKYHICLKHLGLSEDVLHLLKTVNAFDENRKCDCPNQAETVNPSAENRKSTYGKPQMDVVNSVNPSAENRRAIPKDTTKGPSQGFTGREEETLTPTSSSSEASLSLSSENYDVQQGGVTIPPPSVKGESLSSNPGGDDTLNLANTQPLPTSDKSVTNSCGLPIVSQSRNDATSHTRSASGAQGYTKSRQPSMDGSCITITQEETPRNDATTPNLRTNKLLESLTEEEATFWLRWCAISSTAHDSLNPTAFNHVREWSDEVVTQEDLQSLYDVADARVRALTAANSQPYVPPRLGNLKNALGDWKAGQARKQHAAEPPAHRHASSYGVTTNHTYAGTWKNEPPPVHMPLPNVQRPRATRTGNISPLDFAIRQQQFAERVGVTV